jgi:hypothetical protein
MPGYTTLYTYAPSLGVIRTVYRGNDDPTIINYSDLGGFAPPQPPIDQIISIICQPGTFDQYTYRVRSGPPYAYYVKTPSSSYCGYTPPVCDLAKVSFTKSDETEAGANDGTANLFCTTSYPVITYYLATNPPSTPQVIIQTNTTGYFTGIAPGPYVIIAEDANSCQLREFFTILAFSDDLTHFKYRLLFKDATGIVQWELQLYDMKHNYLKTDYPKDVVGNEDPVVMSIGDPNEDKFTSIISKQLDITLEYTGLDFTPDEFSLAAENSWYVQLLKDGEVEFKGYILPDEIQNFYADPPYFISLKATDGLPSLKGNLWGDGSGGQGYGTYQIQQYGLARWCLLLKQCLDQLGYDYGYTHVVSSLRFNNAFSSGLWGNIGTWSDILYDSSGVPVNTYDAINILLSGMKLTMFQHKGEFYLVNWNDLWYINNGVVSVEYGFCFYLFPPDFNTSLTISGPRPEYTVLGFDQPFKPVNPPQNINYDKAYNIESDVSFNLLALLYENPSFEIGAVQGDLPPEFEKNGTIEAYCNYDPLTDVVGSGAADGNWEVKIFGTGIITPDNTYIKNKGVTEQNTFEIDQPNKQLNISFSWKVPESLILWVGHQTGYVFSFTVVFTTGANQYFLKIADTKSISIQDYAINHNTPPNQPSQTIWEHLADTYYTEGDACGIKGTPTTDYIGWQSYSLTAPPFPEGQTGIVEIRFYGVKAQLYDTSKYAVSGIDNPAFKNSFYVDVAATDPGYYLLDLLNLTLSDASAQYSNQTGEKHITTVVTGLPNADVKQQTLSLFTYPNNKRVAGNIFYGSDYLTASVANLWNFALKALDKQDRLPATITKAYSRQYARCMNKFEGDVLVPYVSFYSVFGLRFIDGVLFVAFSIESHLRTNVHHVVLIEISDADAQVIYAYNPIYERSARNN